MSELDDRLGKILEGAKRQLAYEKSGGFYTFHQFGKGRFVAIDLIPEEIADGITIEPAQTIEGHLVDHRQARLRVENASHQPDIVGREIVLGVCKNMPTPAGVTINGLNVRSCVAPGSTFAYYFPEDALSGSENGFPRSDGWHNVAAQYGRLLVDGNIVFDVTASKDPA